MSQRTVDLVGVHRNRGSGYWTKVGLCTNIDIDKLTGNWIYSGQSTLSYGTGSGHTYDEAFGHYYTSMSPDYSGTDFPFWINTNPPNYDYDSQNREYFVGPATVYSKVKDDIQYHYSADRSAYPDSGTYNNRVYEYIGETTIANGCIFASGPSNQNDIVEPGFKPQFALSMNTTTGTSNTPIMCFHMINNAIMLYNNGGYQTYDAVLTEYRNDNKLTATGFKMPFTGNYFVIG